MSYRDQDTSTFEDREKDLLKENAGLKAELSAIKSYLNGDEPWWTLPFRGVNEHDDYRAGVTWAGAIALPALVASHNGLLWTSFPSTFAWVTPYTIFMVDAGVGLLLIAAWCIYVHRVFAYKKAHQRAGTFPQFTKLPAGYSIGIEGGEYPFMAYKGGVAVSKYRSTSRYRTMNDVIELAWEDHQREE